MLLLPTTSSPEVIKMALSAPSLADVTSQLFMISRAQQRANPGHGRPRYITLSPREKSVSPDTGVKGSRRSLTTWYTMHKLNFTKHSAWKNLTRWNVKAQPNKLQIHSMQKHPKDQCYPLLSQDELQYKLQPCTNKSNFPYWTEMGGELNVEGWCQKDGKFIVMSGSM